jgi:predicted XRE-type DNA-binding protein
MKRSPRVTDSSGNVFADLDVPDADSEATKVELAVAINDALVERGLRQTQVAKLIGATQPQVSALTHYRLDGFSIGRLIDFLAALNRDVEIGYRRSSGKGSIRVRNLSDAA